METQKQISRVVWREGMTFDATTTTGHSLVLDVAPPSGNGRGPTPIGLLLTALAGCTAMDVLSILQKKREPLKGLSVTAEGVRASDYPQIYTDIHLVYHVRGNVNPKSVERAIELSHAKYCGVGAMLGARARITWHYEIEPETESEMRPVEPEHVAETLP